MLNYFFSFQQNPSKFILKSSYGQDLKKTSLFYSFGLFVQFTDAPETENFFNTPTIPESINPEIIRDAARRLYPQQEILARL
jgi:hypothetical protein